jgi:sterol desaturase/sphingolipid hydroxylase (fatty acid hydroxylase superfamily)
MIGIPLGMLYANATEWVAHKYVLHGLGKRKSSFWAFHWHEHHKECRKNGNRDRDYERPLYEWHAQGKEALVLAALLATHLPLAPVAPFFTGTLVWSALDYYRKHKRSHLDIEWARQHLPWHYDHHMGPNQNANWCVSRPWFDHLMGTREPYVGTEKEEQDRLRRAERKVRRAA